MPNERLQGTPLKMIAHPFLGRMWVTVEDKLESTTHLGVVGGGPVVNSLDAVFAVQTAIEAVYASVLWVWPSTSHAAAQQLPDIVSTAVMAQQLV
jgi:hypothetical protein